MLQAAIVDPCYPGCGDDPADQALVAGAMEHLVQLTHRPFCRQHRAIPLRTGRGHQSAQSAPSRFFLSGTDNLQSAVGEDVEADPPGLAQLG